MATATLPKVLTTGSFVKLRVAVKRELIDLLKILFSGNKGGVPADGVVTVGTVGVVGVVGGVTGGVGGVVGGTTGGTNGGITGGTTTGGITGGMVGGGVEEEPPPPPPLEVAQAEVMKLTSLP